MSVSRSSSELDDARTYERGAVLEEVWGGKGRMEVDGQRDAYIMGRHLKASRYSVGTLSNVLAHAYDFSKLLHHIMAQKASGLFACSYPTARTSLDIQMLSTTTESPA